MELRSRKPVDIKSPVKNGRLPPMKTNVSIPSIEASEIKFITTALIGISMDLVKIIIMRKTKKEIQVNTSGILS